MIIYADSLFLTNFMMDSAILFSVAILCKRKLSLLRIGAGAIFSAIYGTLMFFPALEFVYGFSAKIIVSALIVLISFNIKNIKTFLGAWFEFWLISALGGGTVLAMSLFTDFGKALQTTVSNCVVYANLNPIILAAGSALLYFIALIQKRIIIRNLSKERIILNLKVTYIGKIYYIKGLIDTGCEATEPLSGAPIIVAERRLFKNIDNTENKLFVNTAAGIGELMLIFPDKIECENNEYKIISGCAIALTDNRFSDYDIYDGVINPDAVEFCKNKTDNFILKGDYNRCEYERNF